MFGAVGFQPLPSPSWRGEVCAREGECAQLWPLSPPPPILPCSYSKLFPLMFCLLPVRLCLKQRPGTHSGLGGCLYHRAPRRAL